MTERRQCFFSAAATGLLLVAAAPAFADGDGSTA
jgi:hypothetical protein